MTSVEGLLARVLLYGTWLASGVIAAGLVLGPASHLVTAGIVLFILLPVVRVALMLVAYLRQRDYRLSAVAGLVLVFIIGGFLLGLRHVSA